VCSPADLGHNDLTSTVKKPLANRKTTYAPRDLSPKGLRACGVCAKPTMHLKKAKISAANYVTKQQTISTFVRDRGTITVQHNVLRQNHKTTTPVASLLYGLRSFDDSTPHSTTRTDDSHAAPLESHKHYLDIKTNVCDYCGW